MGLKETVLDHVEDVGRTLAIEARTGETPKSLLADGGYTRHDDIVQATQHEVTVLVPPSDRAKSIETLRQEGAPPEVIAWRERMETPEAKE